MFPPSTYCSLGPYPNNNSFPSSSPYPYPSFTSFLNPENLNPSSSTNNNFLHDPLSSLPYTILPTSTTHAPINPDTLTNWAVADQYAALLKQDLCTSVSTTSGFHSYNGNTNNNNISSFLNKKPAKKPAKKDRHSKIHTSQGFRDRRVRLSIEIARKFFDLQDMLGFDKASNTLEWLFNKSKKAIEELTLLSKHSSSAAAEDHHSFSCSSSEGDEVYSKDVMDQKVVDLESEERKMKRVQKEGENMKESRVRRSNGEELKQKYPAIDEESNGRDDVFNFIEESIVIKRKVKKSSVLSSSTHHHQQKKNTSSFDNSECQSSPMSPNWDANKNAAASDDQPSNFCAISSMNLSAGLQIFGKSWEECTSPRRY